MSQEGTEKKTQKIFPGDLVSISCQGVTRVGIADTVQWDWSDGTYAIEMTDQFGRSVYWKQWTDGGQVIVLKSKKFLDQDAEDALQ